MNEATLSPHAAVSLQVATHLRVMNSLGVEDWSSQLAATTELIAVSEATPGCTNSGLGPVPPIYRVTPCTGVCTVGALAPVSWKESSPIRGKGREEREGRRGRGGEGRRKGKGGEGGEERRRGKEEREGEGEGGEGRGMGWDGMEGNEGGGGGGGERKGEKEGKERKKMKGSRGSKEEKKKDEKKNSR